MSGSAELLRGAAAPEGRFVEVVSLQVGPLATAGEVDSASPRDEYEYRLDYDARGRIAGARSWRYNLETDERTFTRFDTEGNQLSRFVKCEQLGTTHMYDGNDRLESSSHVEDDGKLITHVQYDKGKPTSSSVVDKEANTRTMTLFQSDGTQFVQVTEWEGTKGWTSTVYPKPTK
jgi:hypothetical protein